MHVPYTTPSLARTVMGVIKFLHALPATPPIPSLQAAFTAGAEERRRAKDVLSRAFEESYTRLLLYGQGAEAFADDEATYTTLVRHVLRTAGETGVDKAGWAAVGTSTARGNR